MQRLARATFRCIVANENIGCGVLLLLLLLLLPSQLLLFDVEFIILLCCFSLFLALFQKQPLSKRPGEGQNTILKKEVKHKSPRTAYICMHEPTQQAGAAITLSLLLYYVVKNEGC